MSRTSKDKGIPAKRGDFLPNLCSMQAVFHLVLVGELLAIALTLTDSGIVAFNWYRLGVLSMLIQWIVLTSAACLCPLRPWFRQQPSVIAGAVSYGVVLIVGVTYSSLAVFFGGANLTFSWDLVVSNAILTGVFAGIVLRYFYLQQQLRNQQQAELEARIQALQARIKPHFLFNSMNSIASLIDFDPQAAEKMVIDLSDLFRASLSEPGMIPLSKEIDLCQRFVNIEQTRMGERLQVLWQVSGDVAQAEVPSLLLQPIIENAIFHGIEPSVEGGEISVVIEVHERIDITVVNPAWSGRQSRSKGNGLALENIRSRIEAHYGDEGRLEVVPGDKTYRVTLRLPMHETRFED